VVPLSSLEVVNAQNLVPNRARSFRLNCSALPYGFGFWHAGYFDLGSVQDDQPADGHRDVDLQFGLGFSQLD